MSLVSHVNQSVRGRGPSPRLSLESVLSRWPMSRWWRSPTAWFAIPRSLLSLADFAPGGSRPDSPSNLGFPPLFLKILTKHPMLTVQLINRNGPATGYSFRQTKGKAWRTPLRTARRARCRPLGGGNSLSEGGGGPAPTWSRGRPARRWRRPAQRWRLPAVPCGSAGTR